jgi:hypothetical protein
VLEVVQEMPTVRSTTRLLSAVLQIDGIRKGVAHVKAHARAAGIAPVTLQRVKEAMSVQSTQSKGEFAGSWDWSLAHHVASSADLLR